jgi:hypothetical protein
MSRHEKKLLADMSRGKGGEEKEEDVMIALSLLNQYKKDPNFI